MGKRILHIADAALGSNPSTTLGLLAMGLGRVEGARQAIMLLGGTRLGRCAQAVGLTDFILQGAPLGKTLLAWPGLRHRIQAGLWDAGWEQEKGGESWGDTPPQIVHCWSLATFTLALLQFRSQMIVLTLTASPTPGQVKWLRLCVQEARRRTGGDGVRILAMSQTIARTLLEGGVAEAAVRVVRPAVDFGWIHHARRKELRQEWGLEETEDPDTPTRVIALVGDPIWEMDARTTLMATGLAEEAAGEGMRLAFLAHPRQAWRSRAKKTLRKVGKHYQWIDEPRVERLWEVVAGCDLGLAYGPGAGGLSTLWAMAGNLPLVGEATRTVSELLENHHSALLCKPGSAIALAKRLTEAAKDRELCWRLRDTARREAFTYFSRVRYGQELTKIYEGE